MPDSKKVIYAIERCTCHVPYACRDCPYDAGHPYNECVEMLLKDAMELLKADAQTEWERDVALNQLSQIGKGLGEKMDDIVELLKKQEPVKPKAWVPKGQTMARVRGYYCPVCDTSVVHGDRFCHWCGRELTWD